MESLKKLETFEDFKVRVVAMFEAEGYSPNVSAEIDKWYDRRFAEIEVVGVTVEDRSRFQFEMADIYHDVGEIERAKSTLQDTGYLLNQELRSRSEAYDRAMRAQGLEPEQTIPDPNFRRLVALFDEVEALEVKLGMNNG